MPTRSPPKIGFGLGTSTSLHDERFGYVVDELERMGFDIPWVSDRIRSPAPRDEPHTTDQWTDHLVAVAAEILPLET